jgi:Zn-dependent protease
MRSMHLFDLLGFKIGAHWSLFLALGLAAVMSGGAIGVVFSAALFVSVLLHELGHAVVARRRGVPIEGIDLHFFGGVAKLAAPPRSPDDEIAIAIAGPLVSLALGVLLLAASFVVPLPLLAWLGTANLVLFAFNLLPALPLDGGRVLRAVLARRRGLVDGTTAAVRVSRAVAVGLFVLGVVFKPTLAILAVLVWVLGTQELRAVRAHTRLSAWGFRSPWTGYDAAARRRGRGDVRAPDFVLDPTR